MTIANLMETIERALEASHPGLILQGYSSEYVDVSTPDGARHFRITATEGVPIWSRTDRGVAAVVDELVRVAHGRRATGAGDARGHGRGRAAGASVV